MIFFDTAATTEHTKCLQTKYTQKPVGDKPVISRTGRYEREQFHLTASPGSTASLCVCLVQNSCCTCRRKKKKGYFHSSHLLDQIQACFDEQHACTAGAGRRWRPSVGEVYILGFSFMFCLPHSLRQQHGELKLTFHFTFSYPYYCCS